MIKKFLILFILFVSALTVFAEVLKGNVAYEVPSSFFGTWRVSSVLLETNSPETFKKKNVDVWNLSKDGNVINLSNPFSQASASVNVSYANNSQVKFSKQGTYNNKILTDTVELQINGDKFSGKNTILLETRSQVDNSVIKTAKATYILKGEKIAGMSIGE